MSNNNGNDSEYSKVLRESSKEIEKEIAGIMGNYVKQSTELSIKLDETGKKLENTGKELKDEIQRVTKNGSKTSRWSAVISVAVLLTTVIALVIIDDLKSDIIQFRNDINTANIVNATLVAKFDTSHAEQEALSLKVDSLSDLIGKQDLMEIRNDISTLSGNLDSLESHSFVLIESLSDSIQNNYDQMEMLDAQLHQLDTLIISQKDETLAELRMGIGVFTDSLEVVSNDVDSLGRVLEEYELLNSIIEELQSKFNELESSFTSTNLTLPGSQIGGV